MEMEDRKQLRLAFIRRYRTLVKRSALYQQAVPQSDMLWEKLLLHYQDGFRCCYCNGEMDIAARMPAPLLFTLDHYIPFALGGTNALSNIVFCCFACNMVKSTARGGTWKEIVCCVPDDLRKRWFIEVWKGAIANKLDRLEGEQSG